MHQNQTQKTFYNIIGKLCQNSHHRPNFPTVRKGLIVLEVKFREIVS